MKLWIIVELVDDDGMWVWDKPRRRLLEVFDNKAIAESRIIEFENNSTFHGELFLFQSIAKMEGVNEKRVDFDGRQFGSTVMNLVEIL
jgi:hypothetical protein